MNKKQPFEDAFERQMNNLPASQEDESWQKMKKLLDDNKKREPIAFFKTYRLAIILIFLLLTGLWLVVEKINIAREKPVTVEKKDNIIQPKAQSKTTGQLRHLQKNTDFDHPLKTQNTAQKPSDAQLPVTSQRDRILRQKTADIRDKKVNIPVTKNFFKKNEINQNDTLFQKHNNSTKANNAPIKNRISAPQNNSVNSGKLLPNFPKNNEPDTPANIQKINQNSLAFQPHDTSAHKEDSLIKVSAAKQKIVLKRNRKYFVSAGAGVQQQVPLAGQRVVSYGYNAKNTLSDYIPSVYVRLERDQKWFLQGEFIYAAPQLIKEFSYNRQTVVSDSGGTVTTTALNLKKAFFNKIPVTFNYYIRPGWSAGVGGMYSVFQGAIAEKEITTKSTQTTAQSVVKQIVPIDGYTDSFLYKSNMYLVVQTNYERRRFSVGVRYTKNVQPYIKYTLPDGAITNKKNWAFEFIVRLRLWKLAKF